MHLCTSLDLLPIQFTPRMPTRQDKTVSLVGVGDWRWCEIGTRRSRIIFSAEMTLRLSSAAAAVSRIYLSELCRCYQLSLLYAARQCEHHHQLMAVAKTSTLLKYTRHEHESQSSLNTAASLWWISALETPSAARNLITIRWSCCKPILSIEVLENNDVINDVMIKTQGMWSTLYMS